MIYKVVEPRKHEVLAEFRAESAADSYARHSIMQGDYSGPGMRRLACIFTEPGDERKYYTAVRANKLYYRDLTQRHFQMEVLSLSPVSKDTDVTI